MTRILADSGAPKPSVEEIFEDILQTVPSLANPLSPLPALPLQAMPGTLEASNTADYIDWDYFENLSGNEEVTRGSVLKNHRLWRGL